MAGKTTKLQTPISKNIPVKSVRKIANRFQETSAYCQTIKMIRSKSEKSKNPLQKFHNKENLAEKLKVKFKDDFSFMT